MVASEFWLTDRQRKAIAPLLPSNQPGARRLNARRAIAVSAPARLTRATFAAGIEPEMRARLGELGVDIVGSTPDEFRALIEREIPRIAGVLSRAGIRPE